MEKITFTGDMHQIREFMDLIGIKEARWTANAGFMVDLSNLKESPIVLKKMVLGPAPAEPAKPEEPAKSEAPAKKSKRASGRPAGTHPTYKERVCPLCNQSYTPVSGAQRLCHACRDKLGTAGVKQALAEHAQKQEQEDA